LRSGLIRELHETRAKRRRAGKDRPHHYSGDKIEATSIYISITECGLTKAQEFIKARTTELQAENPEQFVQKSVLMFLREGRHLALATTRRTRVKCRFPAQQRRVY
jgi:hypothetical protein